MAASRILLVDADAAARAIAETLTGAGYAVTIVTDGGDVFQHGSDTELIVLDVPGGRRNAVELCREIRAAPALASVPVLCIAQTDDVEARIAFLEVGADDVVAKPFDSRELEARVEALILRFQRSRELAPAAAAAGLTRRTLTLFSPRGGVGTTTIAVNIAMTVAERKPDSVVIVDLDLPFGQVATQLDLEPAQTLAGVVADDAAMHEPELLRTYTTRHDRGLHVLAAPQDPAVAASIRPVDVGLVLETLLGTFDTVVIDAGSSLTEVATVAFTHADRIIFPVLPEVPSLKALHRLIEHLGRDGAATGKAMYILNSVFPRELVRARDVETALGAKLAATLPYDAFVYLKAVNEGVPVVAGAPKTAAAESLVHLTQLVFPDGTAAAPEPVREEPARRGLLGLRRRP
ncbi:MAG TPA: response regulator [Candidatus Dormibacteraeota bacterium]|nr:response regulator [Candidatus Dormibacteraeota bacterium]